MSFTIDFYAKSNYSGLFGKTKESTGAQSSSFVNNYYVDENRAKFGLVEKRAKK